MEDKDWKNPFFERKEEEPKAEEPIKKDTERLNDPSVPMRRKNRILKIKINFLNTKHFKFTLHSHIIKRANNLPNPQLRPSYLKWK